MEDPKRALVGTLLLLLLVLGFFGLRELYLGRQQGLPPGPYLEVMAELDGQAEDSPKLAPPLKPLDPNQASLQELVAMGFPPKIARNIDKYRLKGGQFYDKKGLMRMYGMNDSLYQVVSPYLRFPDWEEVYPKPEDRLFKERPRKPQRKPGIRRFELNGAYAEDFAQIRGIGPVLSLRILAFREALGGFRHREQLYDVYGLDSALVDSLLAYTWLDVSKVRLKKLNVNTATADTLRRHPYLNWRLAGLIVAYREQHGPYEHLEALQEIKILRPETFQKICPYLFAGDTLAPKP